MAFAEQRSIISGDVDRTTRSLLPATDTALKILIDVGLAALGLLALAPLLIVIAVAIRIDSRGSVLFRQKRSGLNNKTFWIYKFRTMRPHDIVSGAVMQATRDDVRVTRVGRFLRRTSLDELPQLLNVVRGEMSLVGPRPHALEHDHHYSREIPNYVNRFAVRPGLTGLAQVSGSRGETRTLDDMQRRIDLDLQYIERRNTAFDIRIIYMTIILELTRRTNAY